MPKMLVNCPNCRNPITADIEQLFDVNVDPSAKQRLLSGAFNQIRCPICGYQGIYPSLIVYHDPAKELLITFIPPELGIPRNDQERLMGSLINQVINNLPLEKRKGYLLNPQSALTLQGMLERILEADGITREMLQAQQDRINLIQRLLSTSGSETRAEIARQEDALIDASFFSILRRLIESAAASGNEAVVQALEGLQQDILPVTTFGKELQAQAQDIETAMKDLQGLGKELTRENLLELVLRAPNDNYLRAVVSMVRSGMDYQFFQLLSERIDRARGDGRDRLIQLREKLLDWTHQVDAQVQEHVSQVRELIQAILEEENIEEAMLQSLPYVDEFFVQELNLQMQEARKSSDLEKIAKLQKIVAVLQEASKPSSQVNLIEKLLDVPEDENQKEAWLKILQSNSDEVTPDFLSALSSIAAQVQDSEEQELARRLTELNRVVLRFSMQKNLNTV